MQEIKLYRNIFRLLLLSIGSSVFVAGSIHQLFYKEPNGIDYFMFSLTGIFFGGGSLMIFSKLLDFRPQVIITEEGILDRDNNQSLIKWKYLKTAKLDQQENIQLKLTKDFPFTPPSKSFIKIPNHPKNINDVYINAKMININAKKLEVLINDLIKADLGERHKLILHLKK